MHKNKYFSACDFNACIFGTFFKMSYFPLCTFKHCAEPVQHWKKKMSLILMTIFFKMLSHSKFKKSFFFCYIFKVGYIYKNFCEVQNGELVSQVCYIHLSANSLGKVINPSLSSSYGLNSRSCIHKNYCYCQKIVNAIFTSKNELFLQSQICFSFK